MLDIKKVKLCYVEYKNNRDHFLEIDKAYNNGNKTRTLPNKRFKRCYRDMECNYVQKLDDEESNYSFNNKVTFSALNKEHTEAVKFLNDYWKVLGNPESSNGKKLVQFHELYEINYNDANGKLKQHIVTPLEGNVYINHLGEYEFFILVHNKIEFIDDREKVVDYIDVYDEENIYYLDNNFNKLETKKHLMGTFPVGVALVDEQKYTTRNGYEQGTKTNYDKIFKLQRAFEDNLQDISEEITDFHNAIMVGKNIEEKPVLNENGEVMLDKNGEPILRPPIISSDSLVLLNDMADSNSVSLEWLVKNINDSFIKNTRDDLKKLIYEMSSHINSNEELVSNVSGVALRSRLQNLEAKCKANEQAMECIVRKRIECIFNNLRIKEVANYDVNKIQITFTPCIPQDITALGDFISKVPDTVMSNETKMTIIPYINDVELEKERIKEEKKENINMMPVNLDMIGGVTDEEANE